MVEASKSDFMMGKFAIIDILNIMTNIKTHIYIFIMLYGKYIFYVIIFVRSVRFAYNGKKLFYYDKSDKYEIISLYRLMILYDNTIIDE